MGLTTELWGKMVSSKEMRANVTCWLSTFSFFGFHFAIVYMRIFGTLSEELLERTDGHLVNLTPRCRGASVVQAEWETQAQKGHRAGWWHKQASSMSTPGPSLTFPLHRCFTPIGWFCSSLSLSLSVSDTHTQTHGPRTKKEESKTRLIFLEILLDGGVILPVQEMCKMITVDKDRLCVLDLTFILAFFFTESQHLVSFSAFHVLKASS